MWEQRLVRGESFHAHHAITHGFRESPLRLQPREGQDLCRGQQKQGAGCQTSKRSLQMAMQSNADTKGTELLGF